MSKENSQPQEAQQQTSVLQVTGMTCAHCSSRVEKALRNQPGVSAVQVNLSSGTATVTFDASRTNMASLHEALTKSGYPPKVPAHN